MGGQGSVVSGQGSESGQGVDKGQWLGVQGVDKGQWLLLRFIIFDFFKIIISIFGIGPEALVQFHKKIHFKIQ